MFKDTHNKRYSISEDGEVRINKSGATLKSRLNKYGYLRVNLWGGVKYETVSVHILVAAAFISARIKDEINHIDGNKRNNHFSNLEYVTYKENYAHAVTMGLRSRSPAKGKRWTVKNDPKNPVMPAKT